MKCLHSKILWLVIAVVLCWVSPDAKFAWANLGWSLCAMAVSFRDRAFGISWEGVFERELGRLKRGWKS